MKHQHKLFYVAPMLDIIELKLEGVIAYSEPGQVSNLNQYNGANVFGDDGEDWDD